MIDNALRTLIEETRRHLAVATKNLEEINRLVSSGLDHFMLGATMANAQVGTPPTGRIPALTERLLGRMLGIRPDGNASVDSVCKCDGGYYLLHEPSVHQQDKWRKHVPGEAPGMYFVNRTSGDKYIALPTRPEEVLTLNDDRIEPRPMRVIHIELDNGTPNAFWKIYVTSTV